MFSHESLPLIVIFIIMLLGVLAAVLHPVHALFSWLRRRRERAAVQTAGAEQDKG
ncbi:hypothetical protein HU755_02345 [Pseudomonas sp. SWRI111]|uniref:hypothetical protein n=1 Tax=Pseudomonas sp. SWRI111 TaxID=2745507 RepID=UPI001647E177|nr:hypothetical protein [Pseudomonas sp. SWRI111]MBC3205609.1 hypothetical protein [Pseudomonas sp. SWRI111]